MQGTTKKSREATMMPFSRKQAVRRMVIGLMAIVPALRDMSGSCEELSGLCIRWCRARPKAEETHCQRYGSQ
jgi:hypothetical protein